MKQGQLDKKERSKSLLLKLSIDFQNFMNTTTYRLSTHRLSTYRSTLRF
ncbi:hypothetical protein B1R32_11856, partial [Abditibacterium utsteinense]